ncbi:MAG: hypothetical protein M3150_03555 [Pseudomonadota bacterium]|nr:hypothetical protein [Pseudomonadota bacterium]
MKRTLPTMALGLVLATSATLATAADAPAGKPTPGMHSGMMGNMDMKGMDGMKDMKDMKDMKGMKGMKGMMEMMGSCQGMMDKGGMQANPSSMRLPAGNEKLEFQMHAEMMQKMGEIAARYADRIKDEK